MYLAYICKTMWKLTILVYLSTLSIEASHVTDLADNLLVHVQVTQNPTSYTPGILTKYSGIITLINSGPEPIEGYDWEIYFCAIKLMYPDQLDKQGPDFGHPIADTNVNISHHNGCLHKLKPTSEFQGFQSDVPLELPFEAQYWSVSRTDVMPNWYVTDGPGSEVKTIRSTADEELHFVADFDTESKWKRALETDRHNPFTPEVRFDRNTAPDLGGVRKRVIPTPVHAEYDASKVVDIASGDWVIVYSSAEVKNEAEYLAAKWSTIAVNASSTPSNRYVQINVGEVSTGNSSSEETYELSVLTEESVVNITGRTAAGAFYGIQTLLSLRSESSELPQTSMVDYPRFPYRGLHLDVGRHFRTKEEVMKIFDVMAMYKLNNFYFHLTEDEGWRLEIDGLPELTTIGGKRCFDLEEKECLISQLGSGPTSLNSGSGFYTGDDYKEILRYANDRHIRVTPQINMPGHIHAGIKAMEARYNTLNDSEYLLSDFDDTSKYLTAQMFRDNTANPCITSTYNFVRKVIEEIITLHQDIQPLQAFNLGGDEVSGDAWVNSSACDKLIADNPELEPDEYTSRNTLLHRYFVKNVSHIANDYGLDIAAWEDGMLFNKTPIERSSVPNANAYAFAWSNVWETGTGERAHLFANEGYKVILSHATHLYFDHPQEPDPEERGYYWATRFTDIAKNFGYYPDDVYENIQETLMGEPLNREDFCNENPCEPLQEDKRHNIIGMQCHLFSETCRTMDQLESMVFPRMLAMAERAWHKASWEDVSSCGDTCDSLKSTDWTEFANTLGYKELRRLSEMGINYYVPPPGAKITEENGNYNLEVNSDIPGQPIVYSIDDGTTWQTIQSNSPVNMDSDLQIHINVRSVDLRTSGRRVTLQTGGPISGQSKLSTSLSLLILSLSFLIAWLK